MRVGSTDLGRTRVYFILGFECSPINSGDVEEMEEHKSRIMEKKLLKIAFLNACLSPDVHPWET